MPRGQYTRRTPLNEGPAAEAVTPTQQPVSPRAAEMRRERRRRDDGDLDGMTQLKLTIPREIKEQGQREGKVFRYFLEGNVPAAFQNDWDKVDGAEEVLANPNAGEQARLVLCSKYKDWHESDLQRDEQVLDERESAIMTGQIAGEGGSSAGLVVPKGQVNRVSRQRGL